MGVVRAIKSLAAQLHLAVRLVQVYVLLQFPPIQFNDCSIEQDLLSTLEVELRVTDCASWELPD